MSLPKLMEDKRKQTLRNLVNASNFGWSVLFSGMTSRGNNLGSKTALRLAAAEPMAGGYRVTGENTCETMMS